MSTREAAVVSFVMGAVLIAVGLTLLGLDWFYGGFTLGVVVGMVLGKETRP